MTQQPGKQTIAIHILCNISRSKGNQIMKFGHLIACNIRNKSHTQNMAEKLFPDPKKSKNLWINRLKFYTVCFCCMPS